MDFDKFGTPDIPRWLYIQFLTRNPNLRSKNGKNESQEGKTRKLEIKKIIRNHYFLFST